MRAYTCSGQSPRARHSGVGSQMVSQVGTAVNKTSGCNEILAELVKSLKDDAINILHLLCQQIWKAKQWPQDWKRSIFIPLPKKSSTKECANHQTVALISHASNAHA